MQQFVQQLINGLSVGSIYVVIVPTLWFASWASRHLPASSWVTAGFALLLAVVTCGVMGFSIERLAYRPLRDKPRINSLITAIGISLLLEFGGQHRSVFGPTPQSFPRDMMPGIAERFTLAKIGLPAVVISRVDLLIICVTLALMTTLTYIVLK